MHRLKLNIQSFDDNYVVSVQLFKFNALPSINTLDSGTSSQKSKSVIWLNLAANIESRRPKQQW